MDSSSGRTDPRPLTAEEEAIKQNTDCVYFLASPLTCKKGSECEYRHSKGARLNPRDCRFWLSGNCLNPKCLFRHPPLDGMVASPRTTSGQIVASSQVSLSVQLPIANSFTYNLSRNNVPCYYYLKGACLKGDKCPFMHEPLSAGNPIAKQNAKVSAQITTQLETPVMDAWNIKGSGNQQKLATALNIGKECTDLLVNGAPSSGKGGRTVENANCNLVNKSSSVLVQPRNGLAISQTTNDPVKSSSSYSSSQNVHVQSDRRVLHGRDADEFFEEPSGVCYTELESPLNHQLESPGDQYQNGQAAEVFRDSSPGFDVLVDHDVMDTDYFHERDCFWSRGNVNLGDDYDHYHSDYESSTRLDRLRHNDTGEFHHYGNVQNGGDWDQHMTSALSQRILGGPLLDERNSAGMLRSPDEMDASDLRHRLMKQRRQDGYFSATSSACYSDPYTKHDRNTKNKYHTHNSYKGQRHLQEDKYHTHNSYKDQQYLQESSVSSRLRGRITLPKPSSPEIPFDLQNGRNRGKQHARLSLIRPSGYRGSLGQRLGWRRPLEESFVNPRYFGRQQKTRDAVGHLDFAGPRSLEELKSAKADRDSQGQSTKYNHSTISLEHNRENSAKAARLRDSEVSVEFEGPKPLSFLLKRKRDAGSENDAISGISNDRGAVVESKVGSRVLASASLEETKSVSNFEQSRAGIVVGSLILTENEQKSYVYQAVGDETEAKDAIKAEEEPDYTDQKDGEYDYDTVEGGDYKTEDDEMDHIDMDADEDEDDFAKKIGLIFS